MTTTRAILAIANYVVCALNMKSWKESGKAVDFWAMVAWFGSGTFWAWQAIVG